MIISTGLLLNIIAALLFAGCGLVLVLRSQIRTASDVLRDLEVDLSSNPVSQDSPASLNADGNHLVLNDDLAAIGLLKDRQRRLFQLQNKLLPPLTALMIILARIALGAGSLIGLGINCAFGIALGYWLVRLRLRQRQKNYQRLVEYHLPIVMERIVMAVEAGLDVFAAIVNLIDLEEEVGDCGEIFGGSINQMDPVTQLLKAVRQLAESGFGFEKSLYQVADSVESTALKHCFVHLALAHKEGGELIMPLRELSDSTQLYYQETVEEEIAKLPVKATMPLLCTFAGLIICFITTPLIQVMTITGGAMIE